MPDRLVPTAQAARELDVAPGTLTRWAREGIVSPPSRTAGGHARWNVEKLRREIAEHAAGQRGQD